MARQTRQERQARRRQDGGTSAAAEGKAAGAGPAPSRQAAVRPAAQTVTGPAEARRAPGGGVARFVGESWAELKKVDWPKQNQVIQGTVVVIIACVIVGVYLYGIDQAFKHLVDKVFLR